MLTNNLKENNLEKDPIQVTIVPDFLIKYNPSRKRVLQLIACGWSNASIADDLNFSTKNIESITTMLIRLAKVYGNNEIVSIHINPRARLVGKCYYAQKIKYEPSQEPPNELLSEDLTATLLLVSAGLSNNTIGKILGISEKTVESRLNNLFLQFAINAKANKIINPRLRLIAVTNARQNITFEAFQEIWNKTNNVDFEQIINNTADLKETLFKVAKNLVEEAPKRRSNAHRQLQLATQGEKPYVSPTVHTRPLFTRLNPHGQQLNPQSNPQVNQQVNPQLRPNPPQQ